MKRNNAERDTSIIDLLSEKALECDEFEGYKHPHASRLAALADELAKLFILGTEDRVSLKQAALAHDAGEMLMARPYLKRAGPLTNDEIMDLKRHPLLGEQEASRAGADRGAQLIVRWHHEWWNGSGYPDAIRREQIPLTARILRLADSFVSLTDDRPFRNALTLEQARKHLTDWAGLEFDPHVVKAFLSIDSHRSLISHSGLEPVPVGTEQPSISGSGF
jgi:HD-GYP domain-containing protein (c-di-GMP phosphodiesterase class II)